MFVLSRQLDGSTQPGIPGTFPRWSAEPAPIGKLRVAWHGVITDVLGALKRDLRVTIDGNRHRVYDPATVPLSSITRWPAA
jgi:hypothetical protein